MHLSLSFIKFFPKAQAYGSFTQPEKADKKYNNLLKSCYTPKNGLNKPHWIIRPRFNLNPVELWKLANKVGKTKENNGYT